MHNATVNICYIKGKNIFLFFLLLPIPFHKVQEELIQQSEETSLACLKKRHSLESMCTVSPPQSDQGASAPEECRYLLFIFSSFPRKQFPTSLSTAVQFLHILTYILFLLLIPVCLKSTLPCLHCSQSIQSHLCLFPNTISVTL